MEIPNDPDAPQLLSFWGRRAHSFVWKYFGFEADEDNKYKQPTRAVCRVCYQAIKYTGNTTNLAHHLKHHSIFPNTQSTTSPELPTLEQPLAQPFQNSKRARKDVVLVEHWSKSRRSVVWDYFGFYATADGQYVDKSETACRLCETTMKYNGNTTNLANHLSRYHGIEGILTPTDPELSYNSSGDCMERVNQILQAAAEVQQHEHKPNMDLSDVQVYQRSSNALSMSPNTQSSDGSNPSTSSGLPFFTVGTSDHVTTTTSDVGGKRKHVPTNTSAIDIMNITPERLGAITNALSRYFIEDLLPPSHVRSPGLVNLIRVIEPMYKVPSPEYLQHNILQRSLEETKVKLETVGFLDAPQHAVVLHSWSLKCTRDATMSTKTQNDNYLTLIVSYISEDFKVKSNVVQTVLEDVQESDLLTVLESWRLKNPVVVWASPPPSSSEIMSVLPCFEAALNETIASCLQLHELRDLMSECLKFILDHYSENAHKLSMICSYDVLVQLASGCFHSSKWVKLLDLLNFYMEEMQPQTENDQLLDNDNIIPTFVAVLKSFQTALDMLTSSKNGTASLILPTLFKLVNRQLAGNSTDGNLVLDMKAKLKAKLQSIYKEPETLKVLYMTTVADPRLKSLDWMDAESKEAAYGALQEEAVKVLTTSEKLLNIKPEPGEHLEEQKSSKSCAKSSSMSNSDDLSFLADVLTGMPGDQSGANRHTPEEQAREEVMRYRREQDAKMGTCALSWWSLRTDTYPILGQVARRALCVPATCRPPFPIRYLKSSQHTPTLDEISLMMFLSNNASRD